MKNGADSNMSDQPLAEARECCIAAIFCKRDVRIKASNGPPTKGVSVTSDGANGITRKSKKRGIPA
jgi:hypothetical protein